MATAIAPGLIAPNPNKGGPRDRGSCRSRGRGPLRAGFWGRDSLGPGIGCLGGFPL